MAFPLTHQVHVGLEGLAWPTLLLQGGLHLGAKKGRLCRRWGTYSSFLVETCWLTPGKGVLRAEVRGWKL